MHFTWDLQDLRTPLVVMVTWLVPLCLVCGSSQLKQKLTGSRMENTVKSPTRWKPQKACEDLYDRYCQTLSPDKCYLNYNRKLCCETCTNYNRLYSASTKEDSCDYGNRNRNCDKMETNLCYNVFNRYSCCRKCAGVRTNMPDCRYGDKDVHKCSKIKPYHCYKEEVRALCCGSCARYYTGRKGCEYGDHLRLIDRKRRKYSCEAYTAHFGYARCNMPWNEAFQKSCCGSCHNAYNGAKSRRYGYYYG